MDRDETLPRVSSLISFIGADEFAKIPEATLAVASAHGTKNHDIIEKGYGKPSNNLIVGMFTDGLQMVIDSMFGEDNNQAFTQKLSGGYNPVFEEQLNGKRFTGRLDFRLGMSLGDNKFSNDLRPQSALQLVLYGMLIHEIHGVNMNRFYAFHFPTDYGLFIYKIPDRALRPLHEFAEYVIENHAEIDGGGLERYDALSRWDKLLQDYDVFEPAGTVLPPLTITDEESANVAVSIYCHISKVKEYEKLLGRELKRYMEENGNRRLTDGVSCGVRIDRGAPVKMYDTPRKKILTEAYTQALAKCVTGALETTKLVRFKPSKKKPKQIN